MLHQRKLTSSRDSQCMRPRGAYIRHGLVANHAAQMHATSINGQVMSGVNRQKVIKKEQKACSVSCVVSCGEHFGCGTVTTLIEAYFLKGVLRDEVGFIAESSTSLVDA